MSGKIRPQAEKVLIVDDNELNIQLLEEYLDTRGYEVLKAFSGREALQMLSTDEPDLVLLDVIMPEMDGFEVCKKIKFELALQSLPVIMVTALNEKEDKLRGLEAGADDFISKPIDWAELTARIKSLLRLRKAHQQLKNSLNRLQYQLELAQSVQRGLVSTALPEGLQGEIFYYPVEEVGGDLYDFLELSEGKYGILIADCVGHGVPAALVMVMVKLLFLNLKKEQKQFSPGKVLGQLNDALINLYSESLKDLFITCLYLQIDFKKREISWANAGHPYPIFLGSGDFWQYLEGSDTPLGILGGLNFDDHFINYADDEEAAIFIYTDGLNEAFSPGTDLITAETVEKYFSLLKEKGQENSVFYKMLQDKASEGSLPDDICYILLNLSSCK